MKQPTLLGLVLSAALNLSGVQALDIKGKGTIQVINGTTFDGVDPANKVGCINAKGAVTLEDCAVFTVVEPEENDGLVRLMTSEAGLCTFQNTEQPINEDSEVGQDYHAWSCYEDHPMEEYQEPYYTINGLDKPLICSGQINCFYDLKGEPASDADEQPVWPVAPPSDGPAVPENHIQVAWLWTPEA